jgi:hypothetical protein
MADDKTVHPDEPTPLETAEVALDRLAKKLARPSVQAQIRRLLPKIDAAIEAGATHEQIVETLCESGIDLSIATFRSALYRARKKLSDEEEKADRKRGSGGSGAAGGSSGSGAGGEPGPGGNGADGGPVSAAPGAGAGATGAGGGSTTGAGSSAPARRDPLALPERPAKFQWDPTARPQVTFVSQEGGDTEP